MTGRSPLSDVSFCKLNTTENRSSIKTPTRSEIVTHDTTSTPIARSLSALATGKTFALRRRAPLVKIHEQEIVFRRG